MFTLLVLVYKVLPNSYVTGHDRYVIRIGVVSDFSCYWYDEKNNCPIPGVLIRKKSKKDSLYYSYVKLSLWTTLLFIKTVVPKSASTVSSVNKVVSLFPNLLFDLTRTLSFSSKTLFCLVLFNISNWIIPIGLFFCNWVFYSITARSKGSTVSSIPLSIFRYRAISTVESLYLSVGSAMEWGALII